MQNITLRRATHGDLKTLLALEKSVSCSTTYSGIADEKEMEEEIRDNVVYLIEKDGVAVGSIEYQRKTPDHAYVSGVVVNPDFQGQGIAREAMERILKELEGTKQIDLVTHPRNTPALMLYLSLGFTIESWKDNYYGDGEPRILLAKTS